MFIFFVYPVFADEVVQNISESWLELVDTGQYGSSWSNASDLLKNFYARFKLNTRNQALRVPFGIFQDRSLVQNETAIALYDLPTGESVVLTYSSVYSLNSSVHKEVILRKESEDQWRVVFYIIKVLTDCRST
ncbi:MAG: DUF4019 domain-containing protein [Candidatus Omnitrophica bacterium]|nr:DUF4019 domain-containing protein [Candidatus Omnitrophota bacterium]